MESEEKIQEAVQKIKKQLKNTVARRAAMKNDPKLANFWNDDYERGQEFGLQYTLAILSSYGFKVYA